MEGVMIGRRANGNCVLCQSKSRQKVGLSKYSYCVAFGSGVEAIKKYFRCKHHTDIGEEGNFFKMIKGKKWRQCKDSDCQTCESLKKCHGGVEE